jgi:hypothetical protein
METVSMRLKRIAVLLGVFGWSVLSPQAAVPQAASPLARVAIVGASVSAGFGIGGSPFGGAVNLADVVEASIRIEHDNPKNLASTLAFLDWTSYMERTSAALAKDRPSALIAIDYLFWSVHGTKSDADRMKQLDGALAGIAGLTCPILLGDLPDVTGATVGDSPMIGVEMMPSPAVRDAANARIAAWAKQHANVTVVPIAALMKKVNDGSEIQLRGNIWNGAEVSRLLQGDRLHVTVEGLIAIWIAAADSWLLNDPKLEAGMELRAKPLLDAANLKMTR